MVRIKCLVISLILSIGVGLCQSNFLVINSNVTSSVTTCIGTSEYEINIENPSPFIVIEDTLKLVFPTGIKYVAGSVNSATEYNITDLERPEFYVASIPSLTTLKITLQVEADCDIQGFIDAGGVVVNTFDKFFKYINNSNDTFIGNLSHTSPVYGALVPNLSLTSITNQSFSGTVGQTFQRCFTIINGGTGKLSSFSFVDDHGSGLSLQSVSHGSLTTIGDKDSIYFDSSDLSLFGNNDAFLDPGESIVFCQTISINSCVNTSSDYIYSWGCNNQECQVLTDAANVVFASEIPDLAFTPSNNFSRDNTPDCYASDTASDYTSELRIRNNGTGTAYSVDMNIMQGWSGYHNNMYSSLDTSKFQLRRDNGSMEKIGFSSVVVSISKPCLPSNPIGRAYFTIDSIPAGEEVVISWDHFVCCSDYNCVNNERRHLLGWRYEGQYKSKCDVQYIKNSTSGAWTYYYRHNITNDQSAGTLVGTSSGNVRFIASNWEYNMPKDINNDRFRYQVTLPSCLTIDQSSFSIKNHTGGLMDTPDSIVVTGNIVNFYYDQLPSPWGGTQSTVDFDVNLDCSSCGIEGSFDIDLQVFYSPNVNCFCEKQMGCATSPVNIVCPTPCEGLNLKEITVKRSNLGEVDNDNNGIPDGTGTHDLSNVRTDRLMVGDTLMIEQKSVVIKTSAPDWNFIYAQSTIKDIGNRFTFIDASLKVNRSGVYSICTGLSVPAISISGNDQTALLEISIADLIASGCLPSGFVLSNNDTVEVVMNFSVTGNIASTMISGSVENQTYASVIQNPINSIDIYGCIDLAKDITLIGYYFRNCCNDVRALESCNRITLYNNYYLGLGASEYAGGNPFPYEYRHWATPSNFQVIMPDDYTFIGARFRFRRTSGTLQTTNSQVFNISPSSINGNTYDFDVSGYFGDDIVNDSILFGDDGFDGTLWIDIEPNCKIDSGQQNVRYNWTFDQVDQLGGGQFVNANNDRLTYQPPKLQLQSNLITANTADGSVEWGLTVDNYSNNSSASNGWFGIPQTGTIIADSLYDNQNNTMIYPTTNGIIQIGDLPFNTTNTYQLFTHINSCSNDSFELNFGWDCQGYPADITSYQCDAEKLKLYINPLVPEFSSQVTVLTGDTVDLCDSLTFNLEIENYQLGDGSNMKTSIKLPQGVYFVPGSAKINYLNGFTTISDPTLLQGTEYQWDVSAIEDTINKNGFSGILDPSRNKYYIQFKCYSDCDFISGSRISSQTEGTAFCNIVKKSNIALSNQIFLRDALPPYEAELSIKATFITPCIGNTTIGVEIVNNGPSPFGNSDSVQIVLPDGLSYTTNSFTGLNNPPTHSVPTINNVGLEEFLKWQLPSSVNAGDTCFFEFTLDATPAALECGVVQLAGQLKTSGNSVCTNISTNCVVSVATVDTTRNIFVYKGYLDITNPLAISVPNPPSGETATITFDINNTGEEIGLGVPKIIQYFEDSDNNGVYSLGDIALSLDTVYDAFPANTTYSYSGLLDLTASSSCKIIAVIDTSMNPCSCTPAQTVIPVSLISPTTDTMLCSGTTITIGNDAITGYNYSWNPTLNLSNGNVAQPQITAVATYPNNPVLEYVRTINRQGCTSYDTVRIRVDSPPVADAGLDMERCDTITFDLAGNQPQGSATGQWYLDMNFGSPTIPTMADSTLYNTFVNHTGEGSYQFYWVLTNGVCPSDTDSVVINNYITPVVDAGIDLDFCSVTSVALNASPQQGTSSAYWEQDAAFVSPSNVTFSDSSLHNSSITNLQEGSYQFIRIAENGNCPVIKDSVIINVFDLTSSDAGNDTSICAQTSYQLAGNAPVGSANGYWIQDTVGGVPSIVTYVDSTVANTTISNLQEGTYQMVWALINGTCTPSFDTVSIHVFNQPVADAGMDINLCGSYDDTLRAIPLSGLATGSWQLDSSNSSSVQITLSDSSEAKTYIYGLEEASYQLIWTVSNGVCRHDVDTVEVNIFNTVTANAGLDIKLCATYSDSLDGNEMQGTASAYWELDSSGGNQINVAYSDSLVHNSAISSLQEGVYEFIWIASNGMCPESRDTVQFEVFDMPTAQAGVDSNMCSTASIDLYASPTAGTSSGIWNFEALLSSSNSAVVSNETNFNANVTSLDEGIFSFIWTVSNGICPEAKDTVKITNYDQPTANAGIDQLLCSTYTTQLTGNAPIGFATGYWIEDQGVPLPSITYTDSTISNSFITGLEEGIYQLVWIMENGVCNQSTDTLKIEVFDPPVSHAGNDTALCGVYSFALSATPAVGSSSGYWLPHSSNPSNIQFTDSLQPNSLVSNFQEGEYQLVWVVTNGTCTPDYDTITVKVSDMPSANAGIDMEFCNTYQTSLDANLPSGTATGYWTQDYVNSTVFSINYSDSLDPKTDISNLVEGNYFLVWNEKNGVCPISSDTVLLQIYDQPIANVVSPLNVCDSSTITLSGNIPQGTSIGHWQVDLNFPNPSIITFSDSTEYNSLAGGFQEGTYQLLWVMENGICPISFDPLVINVFDQPVSNAGLDQDLCAVYSTQFSASPPVGLATGEWILDQSWNNPSVVTINTTTSGTSNLNGLQEGVYHFVWELSNGSCPVSTDTMEVRVYDPLIADVGLDIFLCDQPFTQLSANQPGPFELGTWSIDANWSNASNGHFADSSIYNTSISNLAVGDYQLIWSMGNLGNCPEVRDTLVLTNYPLPVAAFSLSDSICLNECEVPTNQTTIPSPFYISTWEWYVDGGIYSSLAQGDAERPFCYADTGYHAVNLIVKADNGCKDTVDQQHQVFVKPLPTSSFTFFPQLDVYELTEVSFTDLSFGRDSIWYSFGDGESSISSNPKHTYQDSGYYTVTQLVKNQYQCFDSTQQIVYLTIGDYLYVPKAFTPDGDGLNEVFLPVYRGKADQKEGHEFTVFDRWGEVLFDTNESTEGWDGTYKGENSPVGVYTYKVSYYSFVEDDIKTKTGVFRLIR